MQEKPSERPAPTQSLAGRDEAPTIITCLTCCRALAGFGREPEEMLYAEGNIERSGSNRSTIMGD